jgi:hypothetical protein
LSLVVHECEIDLRVGISLFGSDPIPLNQFSGVLGDTCGVVHDSEREPHFGISLNGWRDSRIASLVRVNTILKSSGAPNAADSGQHHSGQQGSEELTHNFFVGFDALIADEHRIGS